jgi:hypothetical protein
LEQIVTHFWKGFGSSIDLFGVAVWEAEALDLPSNPRAALARDWRAIGGDFGRAISRYHKSLPADKQSQMNLLLRSSRHNQMTFW